jgi:hypothetical protein
MTAAKSRVSADVEDELVSDEDMLCEYEEK